LIQDRLSFKKNKFGKPEVRYYKLSLLLLPFLQLKAVLSFLLLVAIFYQILWHSDDVRMEWPLHFNISHTSSLIACGITMGTPVCTFSLLAIKVKENCPQFYCWGIYVIVLIFLCYLRLALTLKRRKGRLPRVSYLLRGVISPHLKLITYLKFQTLMPNKRNL
jgi:hypothetical protein